MLFFVSCNNTNASDSSGSSSIKQSETTNISLKETENSLNDNKEFQLSDYYSDDVLEELHKDKIKYSIKSDYSNSPRMLDFYLPANIEEYVDHNEMTFDMYRVLDDYGWKKTDEYYYYVIDDMMIRISMMERDQKIILLQYDFVYKDNPEEYYYCYIESFPTCNISLEMDFRSYSVCNYLIKGREDLYVTYDQSIVLTYVFSWISVKPETNPIRYIPGVDWSRDFDEHDRYIISFE